MLARKGPTSMRRVSDWHVWWVVSGSWVCQKKVSCRFWQLSKRGARRLGEGPHPHNGWLILHPLSHILASTHSGPARGGRPTRNFFLTISNREVPEGAVFAMATKLGTRAPIKAGRLSRWTRWSRRWPCANCASCGRVPD